MHEAATNLEFELAARLRVEAKKLRDVDIALGGGEGDGAGGLGGDSVGCIERMRNAPSVRVARWCISHPLNALNGTRSVAICTILTCDAARIEQADSRNTIQKCCQAGWSSQMPVARASLPTVLSRPMPETSTSMRRNLVVD